MYILLTLKFSSSLEHGKMGEKAQPFYRVDFLPREYVAVTEEPRRY